MNKYCINSLIIKKEKIWREKLKDYSSLLKYFVKIYARIDPAKFCHTEYNAPGTVAKVNAGKCVFARLVDNPEFWKASSIAMVTICFLFIPDK